ncbi:hypothetical protein FHU10_4243 [Serratia fonticola]|jgi:hypothetical protein|uniref:Uncharacterized protein n=1 Tax=Serratia fonticola TaxID=47917 RepID=A0A542BQL5_SERFO|nr:hypothetical protein FHU09_3461 [Serratia fonticola]TQI97115.1 hypothetical protein FHU11_2584 [Serratia fonticola]TVZ71611.1 hypothetical protein FHU10_4243 [Serratia fonticola]
MNGIYAFLAPVLLLLSVISFIIHFRNERRKTLIERPFHTGKAELKEGGMVGGCARGAGASACSCSNKICRYCPIGNRSGK